MTRWGSALAENEPDTVLKSFFCLLFVVATRWGIGMISYAW
jgi:hypothetical protein